MNYAISQIQIQMHKGMTWMLMTGNSSLHIMRPKSGRTTYSLQGTSYVPQHTVYMLAAISIHSWVKRFCLV